MSIEIRIVCTRPDRCNFGIPKPIAEPLNCDHYWECDWGRIENGEADPRLGLKHLMLIAGGCVDRMIQFGAEPATRGPGIVSCSRDSERLFVHLDVDCDRTTWELFPCHFWDGKGPDDLLIGRWPD